MTAGTVAPNSIADRFGTAASAVGFNGVSSYLTKSSITTQFSQAGSFSVSIWMKKYSATYGVVLMSGSTAGNNFIWLMQTNATETLFGTNKQNSAWIWIYGPEYDLNQWDHYVGVYSNGLMTFYKNGLVEGINTNTYSATTASLPLWIGRGIGGAYTNADIDDIGIWNRALTASEISQLYQASLENASFDMKDTRFFPNPFKTSINFSFSEDQLGQNFNIYDEIGRTVYSGIVTSKNSEVNLSALSKGMYFLRVNADVNTYKFLKN